MSLIFTESFEVAGIFADKWNLGNGARQLNTPPRSGSWTSQRNAVHWRRRLQALEEHATLILGLAVRSDGLGLLVLAYFSSDLGLTKHVQVYVTSLGSINVYRGTAGPFLGGSASGVISGRRVWQYVEIKAVLSDTLGVVIIHVDEAEVVRILGADTKNGGTKTVFDSFEVIPEVGPLDDIYLCNGAGLVNNDFLGAVHIELRQPSGNGNLSGMTNSLGNRTNNYSYVDDPLYRSLPDTTDYVEGAVTGDKDTYAFFDFPLLLPVIFLGADPIAGVVTYCYAYKSDAGARGLDAVTRFGGRESTAATQALLNSRYQLVWGIFETKPGGGAWTAADFNNTEFGQAAT